MGPVSAALQLPQLMLVAAREDFNRLKAGGAVDRKEGGDKGDDWGTRSGRGLYWSSWALV
jgi:hypothetical protein